MVDYVKLYNNVPDEKWKLIIISLIIGIAIFAVSWYIFEKIFEYEKIKKIINQGNYFCIVLFALLKIKRKLKTYILFYSLID